MLWLWVTGKERCSHLARRAGERFWGGLDTEAPGRGVGKPGGDRGGHGAGGHYGGAGDRAYRPGSGTIGIFSAL